MLKKVGFVFISIIWGLDVFAMPTVRKTNSDVKPVAVSDTRMPGFYIPTIGTKKTVTTIKTVNNVASHNTPNTPATDVDLTAITDKIDAIENKTENIITEVVSTPGTYVTDITSENNTLNVTKTRLLYVPVRNENNNAIIDDAEIYIVK